MCVPLSILSVLLSVRGTERKGDVHSGGVAGQFLFRDDAALEFNAEHGQDRFSIPAPPLCGKVSEHEYKHRRNERFII